MIRVLGARLTQEFLTPDHRKFIDYLRENDGNRKK